VTACTGERARVDLAAAPRHARRASRGQSPRLRRTAQWLRTRVRAPEAAVESVIDSMIRDGASSPTREISAGRFRAAAHGAAARAGERPDGSHRGGRRRAAVARRAGLRRWRQPGRPPGDLSDADRQGALVAVEPNRHYRQRALPSSPGRCAGMVPGADYGPAELREFLGLTRKFLIRSSSIATARGSRRGTSSVAVAGHETGSVTARKSWRFIDIQRSEP
jgi:hypothetical protein